MKAGDEVTWTHQASFSVPKDRIAKKELNLQGEKRTETGLHVCIKTPQREQ